jgi:hypothetical protein
MTKAWRLRIAEIKQVYYVADTEQEARELLDAGNDPVMEDTCEVFVSERAELCDITSDLEQLKLVATEG